MIIEYLSIIALRTGIAFFITLESFIRCSIIFLNMHFALAFAGLDPTGASGLIRDVKTMAKLNVYATGIATAVTMQGLTVGAGYSSIPPEEIRAEARFVADDFPVQYVKVGMVAIRKIAEEIISLAEDYNWKLIVDPVMKTSSGTPLVDGVETIIEIVKKAYVFTPNVSEAEILTGMKIKTREDMILAGRKLRDMYGCVILKGGHLSGEDFLFCEDETSASQSLIPRNVRGTGCAFSSALTAYLARGYGIVDAFKNAKLFVHKEIENSERVGEVYLIP